MIDLTTISVNCVVLVGVVVSARYPGECQRRAASVLLSLLCWLRRLNSDSVRIAKPRAAKMPAARFAVAVDP